MEIVLNGIGNRVPADCTLSELLAQTGLGERRVAIEVNGLIVPQATHGSQLLHEGDRVEIVHALGGG